MGDDLLALIRQQKQRRQAQSSATAIAIAIGVGASEAPQAQAQKVKVPPLLKVNDSYFKELFTIKGKAEKYEKCLGSAEWAVEHIRKFWHVFGATEPHSEKANSLYIDNKLEATEGDITQFGSDASRIVKGMKDAVAAAFSQAIVQRAELLLPQYKRTAGGVGCPTKLCSVTDVSSHLAKLVQDSLDGREHSMSVDDLYETIYDLIYLTTEKSEGGWKQQALEDFIKPNFNNVSYKFNATSEFAFSKVASRAYESVRAQALYCLSQEGIRINKQKQKSSKLTEEVKIKRLMGRQMYVTYTSADDAKKHRHSAAGEPLSQAMSMIKEGMERLQRDPEFSDEDLAIIILELMGQSTRQVFSNVLTQTLTAAAPSLKDSSDVNEVLAQPHDSSGGKSTNTTTSYNSQEIITLTSNSQQHINVGTSSSINDTNSPSLSKADMFGDDDPNKALSGGVSLSDNNSTASNNSHFFSRCQMSVITDPRADSAQHPNRSEKPPSTQNINQADGNEKDRPKSANKKESSKRKTPTSLVATSAEYQPLTKRGKQSESSASHSSDCDESSSDGDEDDWDMTHILPASTKRKCDESRCCKLAMCTWHLVGGAEKWSGCFGHAVKYYFSFPDNPIENAKMKIKPSDVYTECNTRYLCSNKDCSYCICQQCYGARNSSEVDDKRSSRRSGGSASSCVHAGHFHEERRQEGHFKQGSLIKTQTQCSSCHFYFKPDPQK